MEFRSNNHDWLFSLEEGCVQLLQIDFRLSLLLSDGGREDSDTANLSINTSSVLEHNGTPYVLSPEDPLTLAPILSLVNAEVVSISIKKEGDLTIEFAHGAFLSIEPDEGYEAWEMKCSIGGDSMQLICMPGGQLEEFGFTTSPEPDAQITHINK